MSADGLVEGAAKHKRFNNNIDMLTRATKAWWEGYSKKNIDIADDTSKKKLELHCYKLKKNNFKVSIIIVTILKLSQIPKLSVFL